MTRSNPPAPSGTAPSGTAPSGTAPSGSARSRLAARQAALVAALVAGGEAPAGFDATRIQAATDALLRKRAGEVAAQWPALRASFGPRWSAEFAAWAAHRPPLGSVRDGWDFARSRADLAPMAAEELAARERRWRYDGTSAPRPRFLARLRRRSNPRR